MLLQCTGAERSREKSLGTASSVQRVFQVLLNAAQWPVSRGISSVNYVLSNDVTFSETDLGYQPIVLFWPQTRFT